LISLKTAKEYLWNSLEKAWKSLEFPWKSLDFPWKGLEKFGPVHRGAWMAGSSPAMTAERGTIELRLPYPA
jgi:hypothetical protein